MLSAILDLSRSGQQEWSSRWDRERSFYKANGPLWYGYHVLDRLTGKLSRSLERRVHQLEMDRGLPGMNTIDHMRDVWTKWDWSQGGEDWNLGDDWRRAVVDDLMLPHVGANPVALEIGPGAGRWSSALQSAAKKLILVDITDISMKLMSGKIRRMRQRRVPPD